MSIGSKLLALAETANACLQLPRVRRAYLPEPQIDATKDAEFGVVELDDGSAGLFYAWLGDSQRGMPARFSERELVGLAPIELARYFAEDDDMARSVGLAAINAISQSVFSGAQFDLQAPSDSMLGLKLGSDDHLGMIGNFPSLVRAASSAGAQVTVIERKQHMLGQRGAARITADPVELRACNKILCTASTLLNGSIDDMFEYCVHADWLAVLGPSASFFPDPLFERGVNAVGGSRVDDVPGFIQAQRNRSGSHRRLQRYAIESKDYPGFEKLLDRCGARITD